MSEINRKIFIGNQGNYMNIVLEMENWIVNYGNVCKKKWRLNQHVNPVYQKT